MTQQTLPLPLLLTKDELMTWLRVSKFWIQVRLTDEAFMRDCVVDVAVDGSTRRSLRFNADAISALIGIPAPTTVPRVPVQRIAADTASAVAP